MEYEIALSDLKKGLSIRTVNQSFDWWDDLFCNYNPRRAMAFVIMGDTITDKVNKKSGKVVECFVMPWRTDVRYREWVAAMHQKWDIEAGSVEIISDIHYGGFVVVSPEDFTGSILRKATRMF